MAAAAALAVSALPAAAQSVPATPSGDCSMIRFELSNPAPGSQVSNGLVVSGIAQDLRASAAQGTGIDRVDFFLGNRDLGGDNLGTTSVGGMTGPFGPISFQATLMFAKQKGGNHLVAYAHSAVTGQESVLDVPIVLGVDPSDLDSPVSTTVTRSCLGGTPSNLTVTTTTASPGTPANPVVPFKSSTPPPPPVTTTTSNSSTIVIDVGNPTPGTTVLRGALNVSGTAIDKATRSGPGVDRVDIFLDNRDIGGMALATAVPDGTGTWQATVTLPNNQTGLHTLFFYAHSTSGNTAVAQVPVTINK